MRWLAAFMLLLLASVGHAQPRAATPWIGVAIAGAPGRGILVERALPATPAARAGLSTGDVIARVDGKRYDEPGAFIEHVQGRGIGQTVALVVVRDGKRRKLKLELEARPSELERVRRQVVGKPLALTSVAHVAGPALPRPGQVTVVEFMATWCGACRSAAPTLNEWRRKYEDRGFAIVAVSSEEAPKLAALHKATNAEYCIAHDPDGAMEKRAEIPAYPTFVVIDDKGIVRSVHIGAGRVLAEVESSFRGFLDPPGAAP